jgi:hypothetical protein
MLAVTHGLTLERWSLPVPATGGAVPACSMLFLLFSMFYLMHRDVRQILT